MMQACRSAIAWYHTFVARRGFLLVESDGIDEGCVFKMLLDISLHLAIYWKYLNKCAFDVDGKPGFWKANF